MSHPNPQFDPENSYSSDYEEQFDEKYFAEREAVKAAEEVTFEGTTMVIKTKDKTYRI